LGLVPGNEIVVDDVAAYKEWWFRNNFEIAQRFTLLIAESARKIVGLVSALKPRGTPGAQEDW
jgi:hypothetical protein